MNISANINFTVDDDVFVIMTLSSYGEGHFGAFSLYGYDSSDKNGTCPVFIKKDELLLLSYSATTINRLKRVKAGTLVYLHRASRSSGVYTQKLTLAQKQHLISVNKLIGELSEVNLEIRNLIPNTLHTKKRQLCKEIENLSKNFACNMKKGLII